MPALRPERKGGAGDRRRPRDRLRDGAPAAHARRLGRGRRPRRRARRARRPSGSASGRSGSAPTSPTTRAIMAAVAETVERFGGLDVVVANAGIAQAQMATMRGIGGRGMGAGLRGRPARRLAHRAGGAAADRRAPGPRRRHLLRLRLRQRRPQQPLRGRQGRGRVAGPGAARRADAAGRQRQRRLLRLGRHQNGPGRLRARPGSNRLQENTPDFLLKRITPARPARRSSRGIEERAPRIFAPKWWRYVSALRGIINPLLDRRMEQRPRMVAAVREVEAEADEQGAAAVSAASR